MSEPKTELIRTLHTRAWREAIARCAAAHDTDMSEFTRQAVYQIVRQRGFAPAPAREEVA